MKNYKMPRRVFVLCAVWLLPSAAPAGLLDFVFSPKSELWSRWTAHQASESRTIDHSPWGRFLESYVSLGKDGITRIAYAEAKSAARPALERYVATLTSLPISSYSRAEQFAYWANLYNAQTILTVLEHYPVESIRDIDISPGLFADGPWRKKLLQIESERVSLDDIEHRILRPNWGDPRVHYALNCAAIGCPNLQLQPFTAENAEAMLNLAARGYVNHPRGVSVANQTLTISRIYSWFADDFDQDGGVMAHLRRYAGPDLVEDLNAFDRPSDFKYDWRLNDVALVGR